MATQPGPGTGNAPGGNVGSNAPPSETIDIREKLGQVIRGAINLRIVTAIGDAQIGGTFEAADVRFGTVRGSIVTNINLVEGDIVTVIGSDLGDRQSEIETTHQAMLAKAEGIIERNVRTLTELIRSGLTELKAPPARRRS
jgi:translation initiation factor IF-1